MSGATHNKPLVSVIVSTHNAEASIRRAIESIHGQTYDHYEIVAVDDESTDRTFSLLSAIADRDVRMQALSTSSRGIRSALELALSRCDGDYVLVLDQDGWAEPALLSEGVRMAEENNLELVVGGFSLGVHRSGGSRDAAVTVNGAQKVFLTQHDFRAAAWQLFDSGQLLPTSGKLFSREAIDAYGARFDPSSADDHSFVTSFLRDVERVGITGTARYHVERSLQSAADAIAGEYDRMEAEHEDLVQLYRHWGLEGDAASMEMLQRRYFERLVECIEDVCAGRYGMSNAERRRLVATMIGTDRAKLAASVARPQSGSAKALVSPIRSGNVGLTYAQAWLASLMRRYTGPSSIAPDTFV